MITGSGNIRQHKLLEYRCVREQDSVAPCLDKKGKGIQFD
jgi:hypothetical protein